jgi:hypothetical protein
MRTSSLQLQLDDEEVVVTSRSSTKTLFLMNRVGRSRLIALSGSARKEQLGKADGIDIAA